MKMHAFITGKTLIATVKAMNDFSEKFPTSRFSDFNLAELAKHYKLHEHHLTGTLAFIDWLRVWQAFMDTSQIDALIVRNEEDKWEFTVRWKKTGNERKIEHTYRLSSPEKPLN